MNRANSSKWYYLLLMMTFGLLGPLVRAIGLPSQLTACLRGWIGSITLVAYLFLSKRKLSKEDFKQVYKPMLLSGFALAVDWVGLFAAYQFTTVATATVCYYITPVLVLLASVVILKEPYRRIHGICAAVAFGGMVLVSGIVDTGLPTFAEAFGVLMALVSAVGYCAVIIINKKYPEGDSLLRTTIQMASATVFMTPYALLTTDLSALEPTPYTIPLLLLLGMGLSALAYVFYYSLILKIPSRTVAIFSYADPVVAVLLSVFALGEAMTIPGLIGSLLIVGAALFSELPRPEKA